MMSLPEDIASGSKKYCYISNQTDTYGDGLECMFNRSATLPMNLLHLYGM